MQPSPTAPPEKRKIQHGETTEEIGARLTGQQLTKVNLVATEWLTRARKTTFSTSYC